MGHGHGHGHAAGRAVDRCRLWLVLAVTRPSSSPRSSARGGAARSRCSPTPATWRPTPRRCCSRSAASYVATRPASARRTFGWHRAEILAALVNAWCCWRCARTSSSRGYGGWSTRPRSRPARCWPSRWSACSPTRSRSRARGPAGAASLNMRGAYLEVLSDLLGSVAAWWPRAWSWPPGACGRTRCLVADRGADPAAGRTCSREAATCCSRRRRRTSTPRMREHLLAMDGVVDVHDLHAWTITSGMPSLSAHVTVTDRTLEQRGVGALLDGFSALRPAGLRGRARDVPGRAAVAPRPRGPRPGPPRVSALQDSAP